MALNEFFHYMQCIYKLYLICILMCFCGNIEWTNKCNNPKMHNKHVFSPGVLYSGRVWNQRPVS